MKIPRSDTDWWKGAVFYQIYPRSFLDTDGDGIGDLPGITRKLDYIASLGVDAIWICPFYPSPMKDFGYDISDHKNVDPLFGTLKDFDTLVHEVHKRGLKIIIDLVLSHTSDEHPWFHDPAKKDWYVWADGTGAEKGNGSGGEKGKESTPPNNWCSVFGGSAWTYDPRHDQYYFHNFLASQPDLNFHTPAVQNEALDIARFWLERGVDGFRLDVVNFYFHDKSLQDNPARPSGLGSATQLEKNVPYSGQLHVHDKSQPENLEFLRRFRALLDEYNAFSIGELGDDFPYERAEEYTANDLLHTTYNMQMMTGRHKRLTPSTIRTPVESVLSGWPSWAFSNHDVVRAASRWYAGGDGFGHDPALSKMLIALLGSLPGTVFLYQGEELGLPETQLAFQDLQDPWAKETWPEWQGRDGCRTPIPWTNDKPHSGFSTVPPWLPIAPAHTSLSVARQERSADSVLSFTKDFLSWRKQQAALRSGTAAIEFLETNDPAHLVFKRKTEEQCLVCSFHLDRFSFNFSEE